MRKRISVFCVGACALVMPLFLAGCEKEVSHSTSTSSKSDGSSKTTEKVVTKSNDGTMTTEEATKKVSDEGAVKVEEKVTVKSPGGTVIKEETSKSTTPAP